MAGEWETPPRDIARLAERRHVDLATWRAVCTRCLMTSNVSGGVVHTGDCKARLNHIMFEPAPKRHGVVRDGVDIW